MRLLCLLLTLLAFECNGRTVSRCELRDRLREKITLSKRTQNLTEIVLTMLVCHLERVSSLETSTVHIYGHRVTTTTTTNTTRTTTTTPVPLDNSTNVSMSNQTVSTNASSNTSVASMTPANQTDVGNQTVNSNQTLNGANDTSSDDDPDQGQEDQSLGEDPGQEEELLAEEEPVAEEEEPIPEEEKPAAEEEEPVAEGKEDVLAEGGEAPYDEEGEYFFVDQDGGAEFHLSQWLKLMELLNEEENMFDEQMLTIADDNLNGDGGDFSSGGEVLVREWSLGYHGLFQLSDSYFCQSSARWSQNVCNTTCDAFSNDDITDDLDCFVDSLFWLYMLRTAGHQCYLFNDFFSQCQ